MKPAPASGHAVLPQMTLDARRQVTKHDLYLFEELCGGSRVHFLRLGDATSALLEQWINLG